MARECSTLPPGGCAAHSDVVYIIDAKGVIRRVMAADPGDDEAAHSSFSSLLAQEITQVTPS